jgi:hypothetical protein
MKTGVSNVPCKVETLPQRAGHWDDWRIRVKGKLDGMS